MTDAQLSILIYQYATRLSALIDVAEASLPDDGKSERRGFLAPPYGPTPWRETPALDELRSFAQELKQDSELLELAARSEKKTETR